MLFSRPLWVPGLFWLIRAAVTGLCQRDWWRYVRVGSWTGAFQVFSKCLSLEGCRECYTRMIEQDCRRRVMKTNIHLAALPGQFHVTSHVVHPRNPFGVTLPAGDTHSATLSVVFVSWLHSLWVNVRAGTACESLECGKMMKLQHLALSSLPEQNN